MRAGKWSQRYIQVGTKPKQNQRRDRNREQPGRFTPSRAISVPGASCCSSSESKWPDPRHTQEKPQYTDLAAVGSTSSEALSQSHNPSGLARTALYKLQLPCLVTLNLPNSHGTFLSQRQTIKWLQIGILEPELQHPCFLFPCSGYPEQMGEGCAWG